MSLRVAQGVELARGSLDFIGRGNLWVDESLGDEASVAFVQYLVAQAYANTAPGQLQVIAYDDMLSGLVAPFQDINNGGEKLLHVINDPKELLETLGYLRSHVQGVANVIQGRAHSLTDFRREVGHPVESYKLVLLSTDFGLLDESIQNAVTVLAKAGPRNGVTFLVHSTGLDVNSFLLELFQRVQVQGDQLFDDSGARCGSFDVPSSAGLIRVAQDVREALVSAAATVVPFAAVEPLTGRWAHDSRDGLSFTVGRYGMSAITITLGDEVNQRHNALVTGAVGQGKSNLLSVIIHSLCHRYSPTELQLYLLDFKEGVTLQRFTDGPQGEYLPHARVLGLEADREFGLSVLRHLFSVYRQRMKEFKESGVQSLREFRTKHPDRVMPRIVLIVDEFQMMLAERDKVADEIADLLQRGVRLFRACGIHVILASQTIGGNTALMGSAAEGLFGQVPVRMALKNSLAESRATLGARNDAAAHLRSREAIVNLDYGELSANKKTAIAFADEAVLSRLRAEWWADARTLAAPYVFMGERALSLADDFQKLRAIKDRIGAAPVALLGQRIEVDGSCLEVPMNSDVGRSIAIVGPGNSAIPLATAVLSLCQQPHRGEVEVVVADFLQGNKQWESIRSPWLRMLGEAGAAVNLVGPGELDQAIDRLVEQATEEAEQLTRVSTTYVLGLGMERMRSSNRFQELCRRGPTGGIHLLCWWLKLDSFTEHVGYGGASHFDVRAAYGLDTQSTRRFLDEPLLDWRPRANRMVIWDSAVMPTPVRVIPYTAFPGVAPVREA